MAILTVLSAGQSESAITIKDHDISTTGMDVSSVIPSANQDDDIDSIKLGALKQAIPASCFQSSATRSLLYVARDLTYASVLVYLAFHIWMLPTLPLRICAWMLYSFAQGCVGTGIWILAHECGHGAFSSHKTLNDFVGWTLHSLLMVPYFSWKYTHARHHRYTGHIEKDVVFVPHVEEKLKAGNMARFHQLAHHAEETPIWTLLRLARHQLFGWQLYLLLNVTAGEKSLPDGKKASEVGMQSHFSLFGELFSSNQKLGVLLSDIGLGLTLTGLYLLSTKVGWGMTLLLYLGPYVWVHHWLVAITYLHHTHPSVPYYTDATWTYTKGAIGTIDRSCGWIGRHLFHDIIDHHVVHHLFPRIPFYHAEEATRAIRPLLGSHYKQAKNESFLMSLWVTFRKCNLVTEGIDGNAGRPQPLYWVTK